MSWSDLDLGKQSLEITLLVQRKETVATANVYLGDKDAGYSALASQLCKVGLDSSADLLSVELDNEGLDTIFDQQVLGCGAVGAVSLGEDNDGVLG